jgi:hypothetical protein
MPKAKEIQRRVATIYAVSYLAQRPYRAVELAKVLGVTIRTTYRIFKRFTGLKLAHRRKL